MKLYSFITEHMEEILAEWESFAQTQAPAAGEMSQLALRDHAKQILQTIALDIKTRQNPEEQRQKSQGLAAGDESESSAASIHGALRQASNFSLLQLSAEFRALRATVLRLWLPQVSAMSPTTAYEMVRFNEAIDQALAESVITYSARADQMREMFLAILGHDLRAPLATMSMAGDLLVRPDLPPDQATLIGAKVRRSARLMGSMVDDLLGYTRTQLGGGMPTTLHHTDIRDICKAAVEDASASHPGSVFELETAGELTGSFDGVRLHQLFSNLLVNAAQYGDKKRPVLISACGEGETITVRVVNYGATIAQASLESIFRPLVQLPGDEHGNRPRTSLGLGLFVAREIALAHAGTIEVSSHDTEGTIFTVRLPRSPQDKPAV
jgi:signal transduction histidine kinase